mgnify:CR=1 FL=1
MDAVVYKAVMRGAVKRIQSGITAAAGNVTINAVDTTKTMVLSASKGSAGYVAARGTITGTINPVMYTFIGSDGKAYTVLLNHTINGTITNGSISGGTTDLTVKIYSARLVNSTTIYCDGPVEWQVIEFV